MPDLNSDRARAVAGKALAAIEEDCSQAWPRCPRESPLCDCRLRALRVLNALRIDSAGNPGPPPRT